MRSDRAAGTRWLILFSLLWASVSAPLNQFKVPPVLPILLQTFDLSGTQAGLLMSLFAATGLVVAIPAGLIFQRIGYRISGLLAVASVMAGSTIGALSHSTGTLLASRVIEGSGMSLLAVLAPSVIALWFPANQRGAAMGIWAAWLPVGAITMFLAAPSLALRWNWQGVWWFGCLFAAVGWILFFLFVKPPPGSGVPTSASPTHHRFTVRDLTSALGNPDLWLISLVFFCFTFCVNAFSTWLPSFLYLSHGIALDKSSHLTATLPLLFMFMAPLGGWLSDRTGFRKTMCLSAVLCPLAALVGGEHILLLLITLGCLLGFVPTWIFLAGTKTVRDGRLGGIAMSALVVGLNMGMLLGPPFFGWVVESSGDWGLGFWALAPFSIAGAVAIKLTKVR